VKVRKLAKTELGRLLACLREISDVKNPNQAKRRAAYLKKVKKLVLLKKGRKI